jgi:hypothetical protein
LNEEYILFLEEKEARSHRILSSEWHAVSRKEKKERKQKNSVKILTNGIS